MKLYVCQPNLQCDMVMAMICHFEIRDVSILEVDPETFFQNEKVKKTPFQKLPFIEFNGEFFSDTLVIQSLLLSELKINGDFNPANLKEQAWINEILGYELS